MTTITSKTTDKTLQNSFKITKNFKLSENFDTQTQQTNDTMNATDKFSPPQATTLVKTFFIFIKLHQNIFNGLCQTIA